jgi:hypothetical protein
MINDGYVFNKIDTKCLESLSITKLIGLLLKIFKFLRKIIICDFVPHISTNVKVFFLSYSIWKRFPNYKFCLNHSKIHLVKQYL